MHLDKVKFREIRLILTNTALTKGYTKNKLRLLAQDLSKETKQAPYYRGLLLTSIGQDHSVNKNDNWFNTAIV